MQRAIGVGLTRLGDDRQAHSRRRCRLGRVLLPQHDGPPFLASQLNGGGEFRATRLARAPTCRVTPARQEVVTRGGLAPRRLGASPPFLTACEPAMLEDRLIELIEPVLWEIGSVLEAGEEFRKPPLAVLR